MPFDLSIQDTLHELCVKLPSASTIEALDATIACLTWTVLITDFAILDLKISICIRLNYKIIV